MSDNMRVRSLDVEIEDRRVEEIFEARKRASHVLTDASMRHLDQEIARVCYGAIRSYIHIIQDLIDEETEYGQYIWRYVELGSVKLTDPEHGKTSTHVFRGLHSILESQPVVQREFHVRKGGFMKGHEADITVTKPIPLEIFWNAYSVINQFLAEIGFDIDVDPQDGFLDL